MAKRTTAAKRAPRQAPAADSATHRRDKIAAHVFGSVIERASIDVQNVDAVALDSAAQAAYAFADALLRASAKGTR